MASGQSLAHTMNALFAPFGLLFTDSRFALSSLTAGSEFCINNLQRNDQRRLVMPCHAMHTTHMQRRSLTDVQPKSIPSDPEDSPVHMRKDSF